MRDQRLARRRRRRRRQPIGKRRARRPRSARRPRRRPRSAAGSPATNEYRPQRSERSTDSQDQAGTVAGQRGEQPDRRGDVGEELGPDGNHGPLAPRARRTRHGSASSAAADPRALLLLGVARIRSERHGAGTENPGPSARGCGGSRCERWTYDARRHGLREPSRHVQVIPCIRIRRAIVPAGQPHRQRRRTSACRYPVEPMRLSQTVRAHAPRGSGRRRRSRATACCCAAGSSAR